jgi:inorganic triphosphatase YgiF
MAGLEIELKAGLNPADSARVARRLKRLTGVDGCRKTLVATYYDTQGHKLRAEGVALRIRREAGQLVQTVKAGRSQVGGFHAVREVNGPVARAAPDLSVISDPGLRERLIDLIAGDRLAGRYQTRVSRRTWQVRHVLGLVEVALDRGVIRACGRKEPVCEAEFALLGGSPEALFDIARRLIGDLPANLSLPNKAARGEALADGAAWRPSLARAKPEAPAPGASGEEGWRAALAVSADAVAANLLITQVSDESEGPHRLRVALRRLRAAERLYRPLLSKAVSTQIAGTARDMGRLVALLRDSDVLTA